MPYNLLEYLGGYSALRRISVSIIEEMKKYDHFFEKIVRFKDKNTFRDLIVECLNNLLRDNYDWVF